MKPVKQATLDMMEDRIEECCRAFDAYMAYQGDNTQYRDKAKAAAAHVGSWTRLRSSESNRMQVELIASRMTQRPGDTRQLIDSET